jgi:hypothetical protein
VHSDRFYAQCTLNLRVTLIGIGDVYGGAFDSDSHRPRMFLHLFTVISITNRGASLKLGRKSLGNGEKGRGNPASLPVLGKAIWQAP